MAELTPRQQQVLDFIHDYAGQHGSPPTLREISAHIGTSGTVSALRHVEALERKGQLQRREGRSRGIVLPERSGTRPVPILGRVQAGLPVLAIEEVEGQLAVDPSWVRGGDCFFLRVQGDSMIEAHILAGDLALIRSQPSADNGDIVVALIDGEATLKRFYREGTQIRLQPENSAMAPIIIREDAAETLIVGKLLRTIRSYEK
jgi:repressor LexA